MAKYYVQSGQVKMIMDAQDVQGAALWAVHSRLGSIASIYEGEEYTEAEQLDQVLMAALIELDTTVSVSELGFDRSDAVVMESFDLAVQWHQLARALMRLGGEGASN